MAIVKRKQRDWDVFFYGMAQHTAKMSKDPDRKVGAVLVSGDRRQLSIGYNGFPADVPDDTALLLDKARKNELMVHAERNCLAQAPFDSRGTTLYVTRPPCEQCARLIGDRGVARIVHPKPDFAHERWGKSWREGRLALMARGVEIEHLQVGEAR